MSIFGARTDKFDTQKTILTSFGAHTVIVPVLSISDTNTTIMTVFGANMVKMVIRR